MSFPARVCLLLFATAALLIATSAQPRNLTIQRGVTLVPSDLGGLIDPFPGAGFARALDPRILQISGYPGNFKVINQPVGGVNYYRVQTNLASHWMEYDVDFTNQTSTVFFRPDAQVASKLVDFYVRTDLVPAELRILTEEPEVRMARFDLSKARDKNQQSNAFIAPETPGENPKVINRNLLDLMGLFYDDQTHHEYIVTGQTRVVRVLAQTPQQYQSEPDEIYLGLDTNSSRCYSFDKVNKIIWFGGVGGAVHKMNIDAADLSVSTSASYNLPTLHSIVGVQIDPTTGLLYAATEGNATVQSRVFFINVGMDGASWTVEYELELDPTHYFVTGMTWDPLGLLYLATKQTPPAIIQVDTSNRNYEGEVRLGPEDGAPLSMMFDPMTRTMFTGSLDVTSLSVANHYKAAAACEKNCYGHGSCANRTCTCDSFYSVVSNQTFTYDQPWCQTRPCDIDANGLVCGGPVHAIGCFNGSCLCQPIYRHDANGLCLERQCPNNCSSGGLCDVSNYTCSCFEGRGGEDCSLATKLPCNRLMNCTACSDNPTCGWCESGPVLWKDGVTSTQCVPGSDLGPFDGARGCRSWHFRECPSSAITIGSAVIAAFVLLLFLLNGISFIWEDSTSKENVKKRLQWYRFQRSSKAYAALWQLQYFAITTILAVNASTAFMSYTRVWLPIVGVHGIGVVGPRMIGGNTVPVNATAPVAAATGGVFGAGRSILSLTQALVHVDLTENDIMRSVMATWAVLFGLMLVAYLLIFVILAVVRGQSDRIVEMLTKRPVYILLRSIDIAYYPIVALGAAQLAIRDQYPDWAALGGVFYVVIGIVYPVAMCVILTLRKPSDLFKDSFTATLYPFYGTLNHKKVYFSIMPWIKRFIIGSAFGFGIFSLLGQLVVTLLVCIAYVIAVIIIQPYVDYLQQYLDVATTVLTAVSTFPLFALTIVGLEPTGVLGISVTFLIINVLSVACCIGFYIYSWCQMKGIFSLGHCAKCLSCNDE